MKSFLIGLAGCAGVVSLTFFVLGPALAYSRVVPALPGFMLFGLGMILGLLSSVAGLAMLAHSGWRLAAGLALLGIPAAGFLIYSIVSVRAAPAINDISTELVYPPQFVQALTLPENKGRDMGFPVGLKEQIKSSYPGLHTLAMRGSVDDVFAKAMDLAREQEGWKVASTVITPDESILEGHAATRVFGFVDDFIIRVTKIDEGGCVVDMRSKSRDGKGDLGTNAKRIQLFLAQLESD